MGLLMNWLNDMFHKILLFIDGCIYWAVSQAYQIFIKLADARIFQDEVFSNFARRIYAILGVVMLFYLAYALLNALVDPDKATQGDKSLTKLAQNIVISLVILGFLPTIFDYAYRIQGIIFKENVIGSIIFGSGSISSSDTVDDISKYGNYIAFTALNPFLNPENYNVRLANNYSWFDLKGELIDTGNFPDIAIMSSWAVEKQPLISDSDKFISSELDANGDPIVKSFSEGTNVNLSYRPIISTAVGCILLYIIASFCLDLGVRVVKFAFCQIIAPIPVVMRMIPGRKGTFDKWLKLTLTVYFEVFIRVCIMYLIIFFFSQIADSPLFKFTNGGVQGVIVLTIILIGLFAFAKQAPKMLGNMLGLDSGNLSLGIKDKLKAGGFFAVGGAVGGGALSLGRNLVAGGQNFVNKWKANKEIADREFAYHRDNALYENDHWNRVGEAMDNARAVGAYGRLIGRTLINGIGVGLSTAAGGASGMVRGGYKAKDAKNAHDVGNAVISASAEAEAARATREGRAEAAREAHPTAASIPVVGGMLASGTQAIQNAVVSAANLIQGEASYTLTESEKSRKEVLEKWQSLVKNYENLWKGEKAYIDAEANKRNANVQAVVAQNDFNNFATNVNSNYQSEFTRIMKSDPTKKVEDASREAYDAVRGGISQAERTKLMNQKDQFIKLYKEMQQANKASSRADSVLEATIDEIKKSKKSALDSNMEQIDNFRKNHSVYEQYIGKAGDAINKAPVTAELNNLRLKEDTLLQRKKDNK